MPRSSKRPEDTLGAFCVDSDAYLDGGKGPLAGLTFAAKDLFDVLGYKTGGGNPAWRDSHEPATRSARAVERLVASGATMAGKTVTDELSRGIFGENVFYGTPINPRAPDRVPGGSSSGSAAATAGGLVDFALGTDTGGSVRVPSSFCGLYGFRPSHGRIPMDGVMAQAPSFDTVGWLARRADTLARVGACLLATEVAHEAAPAIVVAEDAFSIADAPVQRALRAAAAPIFARANRVESCRLAAGGLDAWARHQSALQGREAWVTFGDWIDSHNPSMSFEVADNFIRNRNPPKDAVAAAEDAREDLRRRIDALTRDGAVIALPTTPFVAPPRGQRRSYMWEQRARIMMLTCVAGMAGTPQVSIPLATVEGLPVGLSFMGAKGSDETLIALALACAAHTGESPA